MALRRTLALLAMLLLAGCYRQADDSFQTVNSQGGNEIQPAAATPTETVIIIDPNAGQETPTDIPLLEATATPDTAQPLAVESATPTIVIIEPATQVIQPGNTPLPSPMPPTPVTLPTATPPTLITPGLGNPPLIELPTATPGSTTTTPAGPGNGLQPTPTDLGKVTPGECSYVVVSGDNLYRIAVRHEVSLADLLLENRLSETSIIQPGQVLTIPGCVPSAQPGATATGGITGAPQPTPLPPNVIVHTVASGETLTTIARQYGVSLQSIIDANNLTNPDRLAIGQQLIIPTQP